MSQSEGLSEGEIARLESAESLLRKRSRELLLAVCLPVFLIVFALAVNQYLSERRGLLNELEQSSVALSIALEGVTEVTRDHVQQMQMAFETCMGVADNPAGRFRQYLQPLNNQMRNGVWTLDNLPPAQRNLAGQLVNLDAQKNTAQDELLLHCSFELFGLIGLTHEFNPYFQWSYFLAARENIAAISPWVSSYDLSSGLGFRSVPEAIATWFEYEVYRGVMPERNPEKGMMWTSPYIDAVGAGAMISLGAPVYYQGRFVGGVGTDVKLSTLEHFLLELPRITGRLLIVDQKGMVLADTDGSPVDSLRPVSEVLPQSLRVPIMESGFAVESKDGFNLLLRSSRNSPWKLVYLVRESEIFALLTPRIMPYGVILVVLALTLIVSIYLLRLGFIDPALSLINYLQRVTVDSGTVKPVLPRLWRVWADVIAQTVTQHINTTRDLYRSEGRLRQILNNSSFLVTVRDLEGGFVSVNQAFTQILDTAPVDITGKRLEDVFPAQTAAEIRAHDKLVVTKSTVMEFEERLPLADGVHTYISNRFPLYDTDGEIYAVCSVSTDITKEKQSQAVLREAAFGVSLAKGEEVFDVLVTHLAAAIGTRMALIGILDENNEHIHTRALCNEGEITSNIIYSTQDSPCIQVVNDGYHCFTNDLTQCFPACNVVQTFSFESYAGVPLVSSSGETLGILAILDDYSLPDTSLLESVLKIFAGRAVAELDRERSHSALRDSEASYRAIFDASESAILIHDMETWAIRDVNPKACELYGYSRTEMRDITIADISSGESGYTMEVAAGLMTRAAEGERLRFEWHCRKHGGTLNWNEIFLRRASIGGVDRILAITHDISARKATEKRLRSSEEKARLANIKLAESEAFKSAIVENALLAVITFNDAGNIVEFNPAATSMFGYRREMAVGSAFSELVITVSDMQKHDSALKNTPSNRYGHLVGKRLELTAKNASAHEFPVELSISVSQRGDASFYTAFISDLTDKFAAESALKSSEMELSRQRDALRQSEKLSAMGALLAGVAHELNNPLAILMGRSTLLKNKISDKSLQLDVDKINTAAERCARIVHTFLAMARQRPTQRKPVLINDVVIAALDLLGYSLRAGDIELSQDLAVDLPRIEMDADQVGQVVVNLLVNAQQALENTPRPRCVHARTYLDGEFLCLRITDNGPGVPEALQDRIFDPFFTTKSEGVGTGVGLSVSRGIVREHGGEMLLDDADGKTSFLVKLPITITSGPAAEPLGNLTEDTGAGHALIIDDEPEIAELLGEILRSAGFQTTELPSGRAALEWLETNGCDFILSDIRMQDMDGIALWRAVKERHPVLATRMAFVTGDTLSASVAPFLQESGLPGLDKPFTPESVLAMVAKLESL